MIKAQPLHVSPDLGFRVFLVDFTGFGKLGKRNRLGDLHILISLHKTVFELVEIDISIFEIVLEFTPCILTAAVVLHISGFVLRGKHRVKHVFIGCDT